MQRSPQGLLFSPQDLIQFASSEFACWMERFALGHPTEVAANDPDDLLTALIQLGQEHEQSYLKQLIQQDADIVLIENRGAFEATLSAMKAGHDYIYQGALKHKNLLGYPDFLLKVKEHPSNLGNWSYLPLECKLAMTPKADFVIQASCYCALLEEIQGSRPKEFRLLLGNQTQQSFKTENAIYFFHHLWHSFLDRMDGFDAQNPPEIVSGDHGRWSAIAESRLKERDHLCQVANITRSQIRKLEKAGITTVHALADTPSSVIPKLDRVRFQRLQLQAQLQQDSRDSQAIAFQVVDHSNEIQSKGLALLPPASPMDIYFDMEGYPLVSGGLEYLFGAVYQDNTKPVFKDWWAESVASEKLAFEQFIDWVFERWSMDSTLHVYHYAPYETIAIKRLMGRHSTREAEVDQLLRNQVFVDLYQIVRQGLVVGTPTYSIKDLEPLYGRQRQESVKKAVDSVTQYFQWLQIKEAEPDTAQQILQDIRDYNEVDCLSTLELTDWLRSLQTEHNIEYCNAEPDENIVQDLTELVISPEAELAQSLLSESDTQSHLLGQLLGFYQREAKPFWWQRFEWLGTEPSELFDQADCIAGLQRTTTQPTPPEGRSRSWIYEYQFPKDQDIRMSAPSSCWFIPEAAVQQCSLKSLDLEQGLLTIGVSVASMNKALDVDHWTPPQTMSLMDMSQVSTKGLAASVFETVQNYVESQSLQPALEDLLERRSPRFKTVNSLDVIASSGSLLENAIAAVQDLDQSLLCIQGPPGTGKTYTAAKIIVSLLEQGKSIVISANSHAAIANLMMKVAEFCDQTSFKLLKVGGTENSAFETLSITWKKSDRGVSYADYQLTGATAFQLCKVGAMNQWDYLFVDEAGQMSLANLVAIARCAQNIVLMGDQMQLEQPIQANHPGNSGQSALGYYLNGQATIPPEIGIFLNTSYRMHPDICDFISTAVYEGRLTHHPETQHHQVQIPHRHSLITQGNGIQFISVFHEDNSQSSVEEIEVIEALVESFLGLEFVSDRGETTGQITPDDILVVAPYNLQVKQLQSKLEKRARIGTVDKFQGQEAPIVIVSMTASSAETAPRGLDFLLNLNRINVAISRAQCLSLVVGSPGLAAIQSNSLKELEQVNLFCKLMYGHVKFPIKKR